MVCSPDSRKRKPSRTFRAGALLLGVLMLALSPANTPVRAAGLPSIPGPTVQARSALLMDATTGQILYARRPTARVSPGGLAAIMTFALTLKAVSRAELTPGTRITVSAAVWHVALNPADSRMFLEVGQRVPIKDLLLGLMVDGGDDAALALAEAVSGSEAAFVTAMNQEARRLGLTGTHYANPSGLADPRQYTDALDVAKLTRTVVNAYPTYSTYTNVPSFTWNGIRQTNFNPLIGSPHITGFKAGHLGGPNWQLVTTAKEDGTTFVAVVLGAPTELASAQDTTNLLAWAKSHFTLVPIPTARLSRSLPVYEGNTGSIPIGPSRPVPPSLWVPKRSKSTVRTRTILPPHLVAPIARRTRVGSWALTTAQGQTLYTVPLVTKSAVSRGNFLSVLIGKIRLFLDHLHL